MAVEWRQKPDYFCFGPADLPSFAAKTRLSTTDCIRPKRSQQSVFYLGGGSGGAAITAEKLAQMEVDHGNRLTVVDTPHLPVASLQAIIQHFKVGTVLVFNEEKVAHSLKGKVEEIIQMTTESFSSAVPITPYFSVIFSTRDRAVKADNIDVRHAHEATSSALLPIGEKSGLRPGSWVAAHSLRAGEVLVAFKKEGSNVVHGFVHVIEPKLPSVVVYPPTLVLTEYVYLSCGLTV